MRYADRLGDLYSDAHYQGEKAAAEHDLAALHAIPRDQLSATDQIAYDVFENQTQNMLRRLRPDLLEIAEALPMNHFYGIHTQYPTFSGGQGAAPFKTLADYENNLKRNRGFATNIDTAIAQWKKGEAEGIVDTKLTVRNMIEQLDNQLKLTPEQSPYWGPIKSFPASIKPADRARLTAEYRESIATVIYPALHGCATFSPTNILPMRATGRAHVHEGRRQILPLPDRVDHDGALDPEQVHQLGLSEVARITKEFEEVQRAGRLQGHSAPVLRLHADQPQVPAEEQAAARAGLLGGQAEGRGKGPVILLAGAEGGVS